MAAAFGYCCRWRRSVCLVIFIAAVLSLCIQTATHSFFLANVVMISNTDAPESPMMVSPRRDVHSANTTTTATTKMTIAARRKALAEEQPQRAAINQNLFTFQHRINVTINVTNNLLTIQRREVDGSNLSSTHHGTATEANLSLLQPCASIETYDEGWNQTKKLIMENIGDDPRLTPHYLYQSLLDPWFTTNIVNQTVCHASSRFLQPPNRHIFMDEGDDNNDDDTFTDNDWLVRFTYLAIYLHQHLPAMKELKMKTSCLVNSTDNNNNNNYNNSNYQCDANTKYLVVALPRKGAGATFRSGAVSALLAGLAMNRVVLFVNYRRFGTVNMRSPWHLASLTKCPRGDYQCYFLPVTPCVLTEEEVHNATVRQLEILAKEEEGHVLAEAKVHATLEQERVVVIDGSSAPVLLHASALQRIHERIYELVVKHVSSTKHHVPPHVLEQYRSLWMPSLILDHHHHNTSSSPKQRRRRQEKSGNKHHDTTTTRTTTTTTPLNQSEPSSHHYDHATSTEHHAALLYMLRPNWTFRNELEHVVLKAISQQQNDLNPEWSFGIPIRASDKCNTESTCLTFDQYMQLVVQQYNKYRYTSSNETQQSQQKIASLVLTSESKSMMKARNNYSTSSEFPFTFVVNRDDVAQGTGVPRRYRAMDAHKVMLSTMAALKLQLLPKYTVVNCCSNFHQMMLDMLRVGCGAAKRPAFQCLQETDDPQFHVCCQWSPEERCKKAFEEIASKLESNY